MKDPQQFSPYFVAKCFAAYYNSPAYLNGKTIGVLGTVIDNIHHFGPEGWKLKLWPITKLQPEHARRILEMRIGHTLELCDITVTQMETAPENSNRYMPAIHLKAVYEGETIIETEQFIWHGNDFAFNQQETDYLRGTHHDVGFSHLHSLIEADLAVDASLLGEGPLWAQDKRPRTFRHDYLDGIALLAKYATAHQSTEHIGILNALFGAELGGKTAALFLGMADIIHKLRKDSDNEHQRINN